MDLFGYSLFDDDNEKLTALDELFQMSATYRNSKNYFDLLDFINRFPKIAPFNAFLIHTQNAGVKIVQSARDWGIYNRTIKYQARPLVILKAFGPVEFVYDIADTEGPDVPDLVLHPFSTTGYFDDEKYLQTVANCKKENIEYIESNMHLGSAGYAKLSNGKYSVTVNSNYPIREKYSTLIHELGHIFCGHLGAVEGVWWKSRTNGHKQSREIEAESVSFLVCMRVGMRTTSEAYLSGYIKDNSDIPPISFDTILKVSGYIEQMAQPVFRTKLKKKE